MDNWKHFLNCNCEINIEQTGNFETKYAEGVFNVESGAIYVEVDGYHHFNKDIDNSVFTAIVEVKEKNIQKLFEIDLFLGYSLENFGMVKNSSFLELHEFLEKIELQKKLEKELVPSQHKKSLKKV